MTNLTVNLNKTIHAPIDTVFDAWLDPTLLTQFMLPMPGMSCPEVDNEAREGGSFTIVMQVGDDKIPHTGNYLVLDRPQRLVFSWNSPFSADASQVILDFTKIDDMTTNIELTHEKFLHEQARADHEGGWGNILSQFDLILENP